MSVLSAFEIKKSVTLSLVARQIKARKKMGVWNNDILNDRDLGMLNPLREAATSSTVERLGILPEPSSEIHHK